MQYDRMFGDYTDKSEQQKEQIDNIKRHIAKLEPDQESLEIAIEKLKMELGQMDHTIKELNAEKLQREQEIERFKEESQSLEAQHLTAYEDLKTVNRVIKKEEQKTAELEDELSKWSPRQGKQPTLNSQSQLKQITTTKSVLMNSADKIQLNISAVEDGSFLEQRQGMMNIPPDDSEDEYKPKNKSKKDTYNDNRASNRFSSEFSEGFSSPMNQSKASLEDNEDESGS